MANSNKLVYMFLVIAMILIYYLHCTVKYQYADHPQEGGQSTSMILGHQSSRQQRSCCLQQRLAFQASLSSYRNPNSESSDYPYRAVIK